MVDAVTLAKMASPAEVDAVLGSAALHHRFAIGDLASILNAAGARTTTHVAWEAKSLAQGTGGASWFWLHESQTHPLCPGELREPHTRGEQTDCGLTIYLQICGGKG